MTKKEKTWYLLMTLCTIFITFAYFWFDYIFRNYPNINAESAVFWWFFWSSFLSSFYFLGNKNERDKVKSTLLLKWKTILLISLISSMVGFGVFWSIKQSNSWIISMLWKFDIIFSILLWVIFLKERISPKQLITIIIAMFWFYLISNIKWEINLFVIIIVLITRFLWSLQSLIVKKYCNNIDSKTLNFIRSSFIAIIFWIIFWYNEKIYFIWLYPLFILTIVQIFSLILAKIFYFEAHKYLDIWKLQFFSLFDSLIILIWWFIFFKDIITSDKIIWSLLILWGLLSFIFIKNLKKYCI